MSLSAVEEWTMYAWHDSNCTQITIYAQLDIIDNSANLLLSFYKLKKEVGDEGKLQTLDGCFIAINTHFLVMIIF